MIYLMLFWGFFKVSCFAFGGAYGSLAIIRDMVLSYGWLSDDTLSYMIAVSESTPGSVMVNLATYVGTYQAGLWGGIVSTIAVILPPFIIILLVVAVFTTFLEKKPVKAVLAGLKPCVIGIILATGLYMLIHNCLTDGSVDLKASIIAVSLIVFIIMAKKWKNRNISPIQIILLSAVLGMIVYGI